MAGHEAHHSQEGRGISSVPGRVGSASKHHLVCCPSSFVWWMLSLLSQAGEAELQSRLCVSHPTGSPLAMFHKLTKTVNVDFRSLGHMLQEPLWAFTDLALSQDIGEFICPKSWSKWKILESAVEQEIHDPAGLEQCPHGQSLKGLLSLRTVFSYQTLDLFNC